MLVVWNSKMDMLILINTVCPCNQGLTWTAPLVVIMIITVSLGYYLISTGSIMFCMLTMYCGMARLAYLMKLHAFFSKNALVSQINGRIKLYVETLNWGFMEVKGVMMKVLLLKFLKFLFDDYNMTLLYQVLRYSDVSWLRYFNEQCRPFLFPI